MATAVAMLVTGWVSSRIGPKRTLVAGLVLIVVFAAPAGMSSGIWGIVGFRAGWGLGNALFIATSLGGPSPIALGAVFFGWGLLVAVFAVFGAPWLNGARPTPSPSSRARRTRADSEGAVREVPGLPSEAVIAGDALEHDRCAARSAP